MTLQKEWSEVITALEWFDIYVVDGKRGELYVFEEESTKKRMQFKQEEIEVAKSFVKMKRS